MDSPTKLNRQPEPLEAFGEIKDRLDWPYDERCAVHPKTFYKRLKMGWPPEAALCLSNDEATTRLVAFGERKSLTGWLADRRCAVRASTLLHRLWKGMPLETALTRQVPGVNPESWSEGELKHKKYKRSYTHIQLHEAFGKRKPLSVWAEDPRCAVPFDALARRLRQGVPLEAAMVFELNEWGIVRKHHWAFGERKRLFEWFNDPRVKISASELRRRLLNGESMQQALTRSLKLKEPRKPKSDVPLLTVLGTTKTAWHWAKDPRCEVSCTTLRHRMANGWPNNRSILKVATEAKQTKSVLRVLQQFEAIDDKGHSIGKFRTLAQAVDAVRSRSERGKVLGLMVHKTWEVEPPKRKRRLSVGQIVSRDRMVEYIGGGSPDYLPMLMGKYLAGCFSLETSPEAPERVAVGTVAYMFEKATEAVRLQIEIPVFVRVRENKWMYKGRYRVAELDDSISERERCAKAVGRAAQERLARTGSARRWDDRTDEIIRLAHEGVKLNDIGVQLGIPRTSVYRYYKRAQSMQVLQKALRHSTSANSVVDAAESEPVSNLDQLLSKISGVLKLVRVSD